MIIFQSDKWGSDANMIDWITNFIFLHIYLDKKISYEYSLKEYMSEMVCPSIPVLKESSVTLVRNAKNTESAKTEYINVTHNMFTNSRHIEYSENEYDYSLRNIKNNFHLSFTSEKFVNYS